MSKFNIIPAGYRVTCVSSENDADNYKTIVKEGLSESQARLLGDLYKKLDECGLENSYEPTKEELEIAFQVLKPVFEKYNKDVFFYANPDILEDIGEMANYISENMSGFSESYYLRVLESIKIEYVPNDIRLEDLTDSFTK